MRTGWLEIELRSELCPGTGEGLAGVVDMEIAHEYGLPIVPAKRLKGCLLNTAQELRDNGLVSPDEVRLLFGDPGQAASGALQVRDAHIYKVPAWPELGGEPAGVSVIEDYPALARELKRQTDLSPFEVLGAFTLLRTRTALDDESGSAAKTSLRTLRTIKKGIVIRCEIGIQSCAEEEALQELLGVCAKGLRHMGLGRTRGLGEVRCRFVERSGPLPVPFRFHTAQGAQGLVELCFRLRLDAPVMFPGQNGLYNTCEDRIPGGVLLGALAGMYAADHQLGGAAHEDSRFARIFLRGGVKFGYVFPEANGKVFYACPASWQRVKNNDYYYDLAYGKPPEVQLRGEKQLVSREGNTVWVYEPAQQVRLHHARPANRGIGHALGDVALQNDDGAGSDHDMGQFFQYVSLRAGQFFLGTWQGEAGDIEELLECLHKRGNQLRLGRSRSAEYGDVTFFPESWEVLAGRRPSSRQKFSRQFTLWLVSPLALSDPETGRAATDPQILIDELNTVLGCGAKLRKSFLRFAQLAGYNSKWRLPKPQRQVLAAGSALIVETEQFVDPVTIERQRWGEHTGEGCGQVKVIACDDADCGPLERETVAYRKMIRRQCRKAEKENFTQRSSPLIVKLLERKCRKQEEQTERQAGREAMSTPREPLNSTALQQLSAWFTDQPDYARLAALAGKLKDEQKKEKVLEFLKSCEGKGPAFIRAYLQQAVWQGRKGGKQ